MAKVPAKDNYSQLLRRIRFEIDSGRKKIEYTRALTYWKVGKIINKDILKNAKRAGYGEYMHARLGKDLGISERIINRAVQFHREYPIPSPATELSWSHYTELLSVSNQIQRRQLQKRAITKGLSRSALRNEIAKSNREKSSRKVRKSAPESYKSTPMIKLKANKGSLYTYQVIQPMTVTPAKGKVLIDCGFNVWTQIKRGAYTKRTLVKTRKEMTFTYKAYVEKVIDGDTLWVTIDLGFNMWTRQKLRFRGIDAPEIDTPEGKRTKRFVQRAFKGLEYIIICSSKSDKYDRYLADVFYGNKEIFLNQELLNKGLATVWNK